MQWASEHVQKLLLQNRKWRSHPVTCQPRAGHSRFMTITSTVFYFFISYLLTQWHYREEILSIILCSEWWLCVCVCVCIEFLSKQVHSVLYYTVKCLLKPHISFTSITLYLTCVSRSRNLEQVTTSVIFHYLFASILFQFVNFLSLSWLRVDTRFAD